MFTNFLHTLRDTLNEAGSTAAALADEVEAKVDAIADAIGLKPDAAPLQRAEDAADTVAATVADYASEAGSRAAGALGSAVLLTALGGLLLFGWREVNQVHRRRATARSHALPEPLHRWEGEGGQNQMVAESAPLAGATGPDNTLTPEPSAHRPASPVPTSGL